VDLEWQEASIDWMGRQRAAAAIGKLLPPGWGVTARRFAGFES